MRKITNILSLLLIMGYVIFLIIGWGSFPDEVPSHFNAAGVADEFGTKSSLLIEPAVMLGLFLLLAIVECFPNLWSLPIQVSQEDSPAVLNICYALFGIVKITMILICAFSGFMCIYAGFPVWPMYTMIGITLVGIGVCIVKIMKYR